MTAAVLPSRRSVLERDLDLMLLDLLHTSPDFGRWLYEVTIGSRLTDAPPQSCAAWHSVFGFDGRESDVEVEWLLGNGTHARVLIEDKIDAQCQPDQAVAYGNRAAKYIEEQKAAATATVLIAPDGYRRRNAADTSPFDYIVSLESIKLWLTTVPSLTARAKYLGDRLDLMCKKFAKVHESPRAPNGEALPVSGKLLFPEFHELVRAEAARSYPQLGITNSTAGEWVYFTFPGKTLVLLRYRLRDNWVELVLPKKSFGLGQLESVFQLFPVAGAFISPRGETELCLWRATPEVDLFADPELQRDGVRVALATVAELASWFSDHSPMLLGAANAETHSS